MPLRPLITRLSRKVLAQCDIEAVSQHALQYNLKTINQLNYLIDQNTNVLVFYKGESHEQNLEILRGILITLHIVFDEAIIVTYVGEYICIHSI